MANKLEKRIEELENRVNELEYIIRLARIQLIGGPRG